MQSYPVTADGYKSLQEELKHLKAIERPNIIAAIAEARSHGDLSENAEYDAARERQAFIEAKIRDLEARMSRAQIIDVSKLDGNKVMFGATVTILDLESETKKTWTLVGEGESDIANQKLGINAPLARALIGKSEGDELKITTPKGTLEYQIIKIVY